MENSGLHHIGEKILRTVNFRTQLSCRLVNKSWNQILENYAEKSKIGLKDLIQPIIKSMVASQKGANNPKEESARSSRVINWCYFAQKLFAKVHTTQPLDQHLLPKTRQVPSSKWISIFYSGILCFEEKCEIG